MISTDTYPTILEVAGLKPRDGKILDGVSLVPVFKQTGKLNRDALFFHYPNYAFHKKNRLGSAIRSGKHKLILRFDDNSVELYDLQSDIGETKNLAGEQPELASLLRGRLETWLRDSNAKLPMRVD